MLQLGVRATRLSGAGQKREAGVGLRRVGEHLRKCPQLAHQAQDRPSINAVTCETT